MNNVSLMQKNGRLQTERGEPGKAAAQPMQRPERVSRMGAALKRFACATVLGASLLAGCNSSNNSIIDWTTKAQIPAARADDKINDVCTTQKSVALMVKRVYMDGGHIWLWPGKDNIGYTLSEGTNNPGYLALKEGAEVRIENMGVFKIEKIGSNPLDVSISMTTPDGRVYNFIPNYQGVATQGIGKGQDGSVVPENEMPHNSSVYKYIDLVGIYGVGTTAWGFDLDGQEYGIADGVMLNGGKEGCEILNMPLGGLVQPTVVVEPGSEENCPEACRDNNCVPGGYGQEAWGETCD